MNKTVKMMCRCCSNITSARPKLDNLDRVICAECEKKCLTPGCDNPVEDWELFKERAIHIMRDVFFHCAINENVIVEGTDGEVVIYDFKIPEYKIVLDFVSDNQSCPGEDTMAYCCTKIKLAQEADYRYITIPRSIEDVYNRLVNKVNEFLVLQRNGSELPVNAPKYDGDVGHDIVCSSDTICEPGVGTDIESELYMALPNHLYAVVQARSSTSKKKLLVLPGVIDSGYRGRIFIMTYNLNSDPIVIKRGERIAQLLIYYRIPHLHMTIVPNLPQSQRGNKGFGSSGI